MEAGHAFTGSQKCVCKPFPQRPCRSRVKELGVPGSIVFWLRYVASADRIPFFFHRPPHPFLVNAATATEPGIEFRELVETHKKRVYYLALDLTGNHHDAEDLAQDVFVKAFRALDSFRGDAKVFTWLYRITVNTHLNRQRKKAVRYMHLKEDFDRQEDDSGALPDTDEQAQREQMQAHIQASLDALSPRERSAFVLKHMNDLTIKDTAAAMDVAPGTIKSLLYRATRKLRDELAFYRDDL